MVGPKCVPATFAPVSLAPLMSEVLKSAWDRSVSLKSASIKLEPKCVLLMMAWRKSAPWRIVPLNTTFVRFWPAKFALEKS